MAQERYGIPAVTIESSRLLLAKTLSVRVDGHTGMTVDAPLETIPTSLLKPDPVYSDAERILGQPFYAECRREQEREIMRICNRRED